MERTFDPILVEVIKNELAAITEEMAITVWKTGRSAMVKTGDFATAVLAMVAKHNAEKSSAE